MTQEPKSIRRSAMLPLIDEPNNGVISKRKRLQIKVPLLSKPDVLCHIGLMRCSFAAVMGIMD